MHKKTILIKRNNGASQATKTITVNINMYQHLTLTFKHTRLDSKDPIKAHFSGGLQLRWPEEALALGKASLSSMLESEGSSPVRDDVGFSPQICDTV